MHFARERKKREHREYMLKFWCTPMFLSSSDSRYYTPRCRVPRYEREDRSSWKEHIYIQRRHHMARRDTSIFPAIWSNVRPLDARRMFSRRKIVPTMMLFSNRFGFRRERQARPWGRRFCTLAHTHLDDPFNFWYTPKSSRWRMKGKNPREGEVFICKCRAVACEEECGILPAIRHFD